MVLTTTPLPFLDRLQTARLLAFRPLVDMLRRTALERLAGQISCPERIGVPLSGDGVSLSMPASAADISIHKLVNVQPSNAARGIPTIHSIVTVCDATTGVPVMLLDGPEVTGRRTAGISLLAIETFLNYPVRKALLIGTGVQAAYHVAGLHALHPGCEILVRGRQAESERKFCQFHSSQHTAIAPCPEDVPDEVDVVIALTTSRTIVYDKDPRQSRLVIGAGAFTPEMAELGPRVLQSTIYADDVEGARLEAGDLMRAGVDWSRVKPLASALQGSVPDGPVVLKSVGSAVWDLAAARVAMASLKNSS